MPMRLIESLATTAPLAETFSDQSILRAMLDFEGALARAEAQLNVIPSGAAELIDRAAKSARIDATDWAAEILAAGTPAVPFVRALREQVLAENPDAAGYVHWGATSQDLCDTALVLLLRKAWDILEADLRRLEQALITLSQRHESTVMLGRTLMQAAPPVTFGLKAAGWLGAISRSHERLEASFREAFILQFGGASGTIASLGNHGIAVAEALAHELRLDLPDAPWHTHRDRLAAVICDCGVLVGSLGKMACDIILLAQSEVGEVAEPAAPGRGGSSTMPHKNNPVGCVATLAAANRVPGLVSNFLAAMVQENERAAGGWQAEWSTIAAVIGSAGLGLASMADVAQGLSVNSARMRANIESTAGAIFAEKATILLSKRMGVTAARKLVEQALQQSREQGRHLRDVLIENKEAAAHADALVLRDLESPEDYLGSAGEFRRRLLHAAQQKISKKGE